MKKTVFTAFRGMRENDPAPFDAMAYLSRAGYSEESLKTMTPDDFATQFAAKSEEAVVQRIAKEVEAKTVQGVTQKAYERAETELAATFGFSLDNLKDVPQGERLKTLTKMVKDAQAAQIEALKNGDVKTLSEQNAALQKAINDAKTAFEEEKAQILQGFERKQAEAKANDLVFKTLSGRKDLVVTAANAADFLRFDLLQNGYEVQFRTEGENEVAYIVKDGNLVKDPANPLGNLTITNFLNSVLKNRELIAQNRGRADGDVPLPTDSKFLAPNVRRI